MAELSYTWWIANKAKTLFNEPLSAALKTIEPDQERWKKTFRWAEVAESLHKKLPVVLNAIDATSKKCLPRVHDTTKANLKILKVQATELQNEVREALKQYDNTLQEIGKWQATIYKDVMVTLKHPDPGSLDNLMSECIKMGTCANNKGGLKHKSFERIVWLGGGSQGGGLYGFCKKLKDALKKGKKEEIETWKKGLMGQVVNLASFQVG